MQDERCAHIWSLSRECYKNIRIYGGQADNGILTVPLKAQNRHDSFFVLLCRYEAKLDEYTSETADIFKSALDAAREVLANETATQEQVKEAYANLQNAIFELRLIPNKDKLEDLNNKVENMDLSGYTAETTLAVRNALKEAKAVYDDKDATQQEAKAVYDDKDATQQEVDTALTKLAKAVDGLKKSDVSKPESDKKPGTSGDNKKPAKTGDTTSPIGWGAAGMAAVLAVVAAFLARRKKR